MSESKPKDWISEEIDELVADMPFWSAAQRENWKRRTGEEIPDGIALLKTELASLRARLAEAERERDQARQRSEFLEAYCIAYIDRADDQERRNVGMRAEIKGALRRRDAAEKAAERDRDIGREALERATAAEARADDLERDLNAIYEALDGAAYKPGDHPVMPTKLYVFMQTVKAIRASALVQREKEGGR